MAKREVLPPQTIYCPLCKDGGGVAEYCYQTNVTTTGVQVHAYKCPGCDKFLLMRWHPSHPAQFVVSSYEKEKPRVVRTGSRTTPEVS